MSFFHFQKSATVAELDPNKFIKTGPIQLQTQLPDEITGGDEGLDDSDTERDKHLTISEAFADDDVVADFRFVLFFTSSYNLLNHLVW